MRCSQLRVRLLAAHTLAFVLAGLAGVAGLVACGSEHGAVPPAADRTRPAGHHAELLARHADTAYVVDQAGVLPVNFATGRTGRLIAIPGIRAAAIAISPDGHTAYVSTLHSVVPVYLAAGKAGAPISVPGGPGAIAVAPDGRTIYVLAGRGVVPGDLASRQVGRPISTPGFQGTGIAIAPGGLTAYVTGSSTGQAAEDFGVLPVNLISGVAGRLISLTDRPGSIVIAPGGQMAYLAAGDSMIPVNLMTDQAGLAIAVHASSGSIAIAPDGRTAYLAGLRNSDAGVLVPVDLGSETAGLGIGLPGVKAAVSGLAISPDGRTAVLTTPTSIIPVNLPTGRAARPIRIAAGAYAVALGP